MVAAYLQKSLAYSISLTLSSLFTGWLFSILDGFLGLPKLLPWPANLLGVLPLALAFGLRFWAGFLFYKENTRIVSLRAPRRLITTGPWKYSRNPLYLGLVLLGFGASLIFATLSLLVLLLFGIFVLHLLILREERLLEQEFGESYLEYNSRVRRWF